MTFEIENTLADFLACWLWPVALSTSVQSFINLTVVLLNYGNDSIRYPWNWAESGQISQRFWFNLSRSAKIGKIQVPRRKSKK